MKSEKPTLSMATEMRYVTRDQAAFDPVAADYDREFTHTRLARTLRQIVWMRLAERFRPGMRVLEIGCGTGEDAVWLAQRGVRVVATDAAPAMLDVTRKKAQRAGVLDNVETFLLDATSPLDRLGAARFVREGQGVRGAFSNFGALNCVGDLGPIASALAEWVQPGGWLVLVMINRWCAWEILWHVIHLQPRVAFRRLRRGGVQARVGEGTLHVWYPSIGSIRRALAPAFHLKRVTGLGVFLPPSYLESVVTNRLLLFRLLSRLEHATASIFPFTRIADHVIIELERPLPDRVEI